MISSPVERGRGTGLKGELARLNAAATVRRRPLLICLARAKTILTRSAL